MKKILFILLLTATLALGAPYEVSYYMPTGNSGTQKIVVEASDSGAARRIFQAQFPTFKIIEVKQLPKK